MKESNEKTFFRNACIASTEATMAWERLNKARADALKRADVHSDEWKRFTRAASEYHHALNECQENLLKAKTHWN